MSTPSQPTKFSISIIPPAGPSTPIMPTGNASKIEAFNKKLNAFTTNSKNPIGTAICEKLVDIANLLKHLPSSHPNASQFKAVLLSAQDELGILLTDRTQHTPERLNTICQKIVALKTPMKATLEVPPDDRLRPKNKNAKE